jgi:hypothetical protein
MEAALGSSRERASSESGIFETGIDSPVVASARRKKHWITITSKHALVDYAIARQQKAVCRELCQRRIGHFVYIARSEIARNDGTPFEQSDE